MKVTTIAFALASLTFAGAVGAETMSVEDRKATMDAQLELMKKQEELDTARRNAASRTAKAVPTVLSVSIIGGNRRALLLLSDGRSEHFTVGEEIQNGMFLATVELRKVVAEVRRGRKSASIPLEWTSTQLGGPGAQGNMTPSSQVPPLPASLLPPPPVVQLPSLKPMPAPATQAPQLGPQAVLPAAPGK